MRRLAALVAAVPCCCGSPAAAQAPSPHPVDAVRLRAAVRLPVGIHEQGPRAAAHGRQWLPVETAPSAEAAAALRKAVLKDPADAESWARLGFTLEALRDLPSARDAYGKAADAYRGRAEAAPRSARLLAAYGAALYSAGRVEDARTALERAVEVDGSDADAWLAMGEYHAAMAARTLRGPAGVRGDLPPGDPLDTRVSAETVDAVRGHLNSARRALDQAAAAHNADWRAFTVRGPFLAFTQPTLLAICRAAESEPLTLREAEFKARAGMGAVRVTPPEAIQDYERAADLAPDNPRVVGAAISMRLMAARPAGRAGASPLDGLPGDQRKALEARRAGLERLAAGADEPVRAEALATLGLVDALLGARTRAEERLRQAVHVDARCALGWSQLEALLARERRDVDLMVMLEERARLEGTPVAHLRLAQAYDRAGRSEDAEQQARLASRADHDTFEAHACLAALLLRRADTPAVLQEAGRELEAAGKAYGRAPNGTAWSDLNTLRAVHRALSGDSEEAAKTLNQVLVHDPGHAGAREALSLLASAPRDGSAP